jgi:diguanylate cyclase (GGDEF)-like protein
MIRKCIYRDIWRKFCALAVLACAVLAVSGLAGAEDILDVDSKTRQVDLSNYRAPIASQRAKISIQGPGDAQPVELQAKGQGPTYYWSLFSFRNTSPADLEFVLAIAPQRFSGSGLWRISSYGDSVIATTATSHQDQIVTTQNADMKAYGFHVASGKTINLAVESATSDINAELWQPQALADHFAMSSFLRGLLLGIGLLTTLGVLAIYAFRPHAAFLAAWLFAMAALVFMAFESGYIPDAAQIVPGIALDASVMRAIIESLLAISLVACVMYFTDIRKNRPVLGLALFLLLGLVLANVILAFVEPIQAAAAARLAFVLAVITGFIATQKIRKENLTIIDPNLLFWSTLALWTVYAGFTSLSSSHSFYLSALLTAGLSSVLVCMMLVLLRFVFSQGMLAKPFITDSSRRSLALSGASHVLWDWQPQRGFLDLGEELPRSLGYHEQDWTMQARRLFKEIMHPVDMAVYHAEVERPRIQPGQVIELELRLRHAEGDYRWYALRARALPGPDGHLDRCIGTLTDITKAKENEERLLTDAVHDPVTGLPSRALFMDRVERELGKPASLPIRIMLVDLDRFKTLNEGLGHDYGDRLLQIAGNRILDCLASDESVARISGSQFAVLCVEVIARRSVTTLAENITKALAEPVSLPQQEVVLTASYGISNASSRGVSVLTLQQQAASALLEARRRGGAQAVVFDTSLKDERAAELALEADLRRAIAGDEIEVLFQPIADLNTMDIAGFEALARWRHPKQGLLPPKQFIDMAEKAGMIGEVGQIVLSTAARHLGVWQRVLRRDRAFFVAVNISPSHLMEVNFLEQVQQILGREGLNPNSLKIEVTESVIMRHPERAAKLFERLRSLDVGLACDDFGTGFSSLSSLRDLPFDTLKIDRSFIAPENFDDRSGMIITTISELAHSLGMVVVAEGIETQDQIDRLAALGCDLGQGYLIGQPVSASSVAEMLAILPTVTSLDLRRPTFAEINASKSPGTFGKRDALPKPDEQYTPPPGRAPMAPRQLDEFEQPEELPSIFAVSRFGTVPVKKPMRPPMAKKSVKRSKPKPVKRGKKR